MMTWVGLRIVFVAFPGPTRCFLFNMPWTRQHTGILIRFCVAIGLDESSLK